MGVTNFINFINDIIKNIDYNFKLFSKDKILNMIHNFKSKGDINYIVTLKKFMLYFELVFPYIYYYKPRSIPKKIDSNCSKNKGMKIVIIGGGASGIHMAFSLKQRGYTNINILEKNSYLGGKTKTENIGDNTLWYGAAAAIGDVYEKYVGKFIKKYNIEKKYFSNGTIKYKDRTVPRDQYSFIINNIKDEDKIYYYKTQIKAYKQLHERLLGNNEFYIPIIWDNEKDLKKNFYELLKDYNLDFIISECMTILTSQGYGDIRNLPSLYGLLWLDPSCFLPYKNNGLLREDPYSIDYQKLLEYMVLDEKLQIHLNCNVKNIQRYDNGKGKIIFDNNIELRDSVVIKDFTQIGDSDEIEFDLLFIASNSQEALYTYLYDAKKGWEEDLFSRDKQYWGTFTTSQWISQNKLPEKYKVYAEYYNSCAGNYPCKPEAQETVFIRNEKIFQGNFNEKGSNIIAIVNQCLPEIVNKGSEKDYKRLLNNSGPLENSDPEIIKKNIQSYPDLEIYPIHQKKYKYFTQWKPEYINKGYMQKLIKLQGTDSTFHIGGDCIFECISFIFAYNELLLHLYDF